MFTRDKEMTIKYAFSKRGHVNSNKCPNYDLRTPQYMGTTQYVLKTDYNNAEIRYYKINFKHFRNVLFNN